MVNRFVNAHWNEMSPPHHHVVVPDPDSQALVCGQKDSKAKKVLSDWRKRAAMERRGAQFDQSGHVLG
jgi:hypothetical protein